MILDQMKSMRNIQEKSGMQKFFTSNWYENLMNCLFFWKDITGMIEPCSPGGPKTEQQQAIEKEKEGMSS